MRLPWWHLTLIGMPLLLAGAGVLLVAPLVVYGMLRQDPETGMRVTDFDRLLQLGSYGRKLARDYAHDQFHHWRHYGLHYARTPGIILPGWMTADVQGILGPPEIHTADHDIWWLSRDKMGKQMVAAFDDQAMKVLVWNERLVAEYDGDGHLLRLFVPQSGGTDLPVERSPPRDEAPPALEADVAPASKAGP
jgi:hypothetical protein